MYHQVLTLEKQIPDFNRYPLDMTDSSRTLRPGEHHGQHLAVPTVGEGILSKFPGPENYRPGPEPNGAGEDYGGILGDWTPFPEPREWLHPGN